MKLLSILTINNAILVILIFTTSNSIDKINEMENCKPVIEWLVMFIYEFGRTKFDHIQIDRIASNWFPSTFHLMQSTRICC